MSGMSHHEVVEVRQVLFTVAGRLLAEARRSADEALDKCCMKRAWRCGRDGVSSYPSSSMTTAAAWGIV